MKHSTLFITALLLALGSLFVGLQIGKAKLSSTSNPEQTIPTESLQQGPSTLATNLEQESQLLIGKLKSEIQQLRSELAQKDSLIASMQSSLGLLEQQVEIAYEEVEMDETAAATPFHDEPLTLSLEAVEQYIPSPFADIIAKQDGDMVEIFQRHHQAEIDSEWATNEEQSFQDLIDNHPQGHNLKIDSINCKQSTCEIRGYELAPQAWMDVSAGFQQLNHGRSVSSYSTLFGTEEGTLFYMLSEYKPDPEDE
ncbi:hypothetical protein [Shewanella maritima]|uniref:hypothetical protein n=1 Tax=Shewanella maritima TaxID=2520507 RepID=UPI003736B067